jgi:NitT/TauT family transport system substrate-binding protein
MQSAQTRRRLLATLSSATAASVFGGTRISAQEAPPETTTIRLGKIPGICIAPQYVAEDLLRSEGFKTDLGRSISAASSPRTMSSCANIRWQPSAP